MWARRAVGAESVRRELLSRSRSTPSLQGIAGTRARRFCSAASMPRVEPTVRRVPGRAADLRPDAARPSLARRARPRRSMSRRPAAAAAAARRPRPAPTAVILATDACPAPPPPPPPPAPEPRARLSKSHVEKGRASPATAGPFSLCGAQAACAWSPGARRVEQRRAQRFGLRAGQLLAVRRRSDRKRRPRARHKSRYAPNGCGGRSSWIARASRASSAAGRAH